MSAVLAMKSPPFLKLEVVVPDGRDNYPFELPVEFLVGDPVRPFSLPFKDKTYAGGCTMLDPGARGRALRRCWFPI